MLANRRLEVGDEATSTNEASFPHCLNLLQYRISVPKLMGEN